MLCRQNCLLFGFAVVVAFAGLAKSQTDPGQPKFEVASVKPCKTVLGADARSGGGITSPGTLDVNCQTVKGLIQMAYVIFASGRRVNPASVPIEGGPGWIDSERYTIVAKIGGDSVQKPSQIILHGPMLQTLLEERFNLTIHREKRDAAIYALTVAKGGAKLRPFHGGCNPWDIRETFPPAPPPENYCPSYGTFAGGIVKIEARATSLDDLCQLFLANLDRPVINRTGIEGRFDIHLEFAPDTNPTTARGGPDTGLPGTAAAPDPSAPSIFTALQEQLGLKLEPVKGPREFLVIDSVQRPSEN